MNTTHLVILILLVIDAGIILLAYRLDKIMYKPSVFMHLEPVNSTLFMNREYDEPINRVLLSKGGTLLITIFFLAVMLIELAR